MLILLENSTISFLSKAFDNELFLPDEIVDIPRRLNLNNKIIVDSKNHEKLTPKEIIDKKSEAFSVIDVEIGKIDWLYLKREGHRRANIFVKESAKDTWVSP